MELESNTHVGSSGLQLLHFTPFPFPCSIGVYLFAQLFPLRKMHMYSHLVTLWALCFVFWKKPPFLYHCGPQVVTPSILVASSAV